MSKYDVTILTDSRYVDPADPDWYVENLLKEDNLVKEALEKKGLSVWRTNWDNSEFDWSETSAVIFRSTWDYFHRFDEFTNWLHQASLVTRLINPLEQVMWNMDKHYLKDLEQRKINIPPTEIIEPGDSRKLKEVLQELGWDKVVIKPAISGAARHTYLLNMNTVEDHEENYRELVATEAMLVQPFQDNVVVKGEVAYMVFAGKFTHAVLKIAKPGDFRVQDDFGGTVEEYTPSEEEILFVELAVSACEPIPIYARVDVILDNDNQLAVTELELIEPELWFRFHPPAADDLAEAIFNTL